MLLGETTKMTLLQSVTDAMDIALTKENKIMLMLDNFLFFFSSISTLLQSYKMDSLSLPH